MRSTCPLKGALSCDHRDDGAAIYHTWFRAARNRTVANYQVAANGRPSIARLIGMKSIWQDYGASNPFAQDYAGGLSNHRQVIRQPRPDPHRFRADGQPRAVVGFDENAADRPLALGGRHLLRRKLADEAGDRHVLLHADNAVIIPAHA